MIRQPPPPPPRYSTREQRIRDCEARREEAYRREIKRRNIGSVLCDVHDLHDQYSTVFGKALVDTNSVLPLTLPMVSNLKRSYNIDYHIAATKFKAFASVKYVEEMLDKAVPVLDNVEISDVELCKPEKKYTLKVRRTKEIVVNMHYVVVKSQDIEQEDGFPVYHSICIGNYGDGYFFNAASMDAEESLKNGDRITVFKKTDTREFEAWTRLARDIRQKEYLSRKVFVPDVQFDERREIFEPQLDQNRFNAQQKIAIKSMLNQDPRQLFVLFGPPGTGKTYTLIAAMEAIKKEFERRGETARFLICAHSNMAVDNFAKALLEAGIFEEDEIHRAYSSTRSHILTPEIFKPITRRDGLTGLYITPSSRKFKNRIRVVLCTIGHCYTLTKVFDNDFFTHIYVDEGGQAMDGEAMMPLFTFGNAKTVFVVAGDPKQLSATITSDTLRNPEYNAKWSILDRLYTCPEYANFRADQRCWVMLHENRRSHPLITELASTLFYESQLIGFEIANFAQFHYSLNDDIEDPVIFVAIQGRQESVNFSYKNEEECVEVLRIVQHLKRKYQQISDCDIGVVTPYNANVSAVRKLLCDNGLRDVAVDCVEKFQGSERNIIIISAVRTDGIGFLRDPKRLCVAISRPQRLLVILGDPRNLIRDPNWKCLIKYLYERNCVMPLTYSWGTLNLQ